jgi:putative GTP pyrophosphokinase
MNTVWQHAWSEANHEVGYTPFDKLSRNHLRRRAFTAPQAWGVGRIFDELAVEHRET